MVLSSSLSFGNNILLDRRLKTLRLLTPPPHSDHLVAVVKVSRTPKQNRPTNMFLKKNVGGGWANACVYVCMCVGYCLKLHLMVAQESNRTMDTDSQRHILTQQRHKR
ncbi:hypothetical protein AMECASPLE_021736 [Ameca splendens]|uniref:Uncharacterized protein n=1 Tax=Ameca splendens TaxID=208324 RepID=A0ABV0YEW9_9TELE